MIDMRKQMRAESGVSWTALFATTGTLICCALPITLVTLGMGATVAAMTSSFPILITLSQHKAWIFASSGLMLVASAWLMYRPGRACPADPGLAAACNRARIWNRRVFRGSVTLWGIGFFAAFLLLPLRKFIGW